MAADLMCTLHLPDALIATLRERVDVAEKGPAMRAVANELLSAALGTQRAYAFVTIASARASQTVTCSAAGGVPDDTLVVAGTTLTNKASPANENEFADAATDALLAASVAACINAHSTLSKIVFAVVTTSASGIITIYSIAPGPIGNLVTLAETGNGFTLGGAALTGGASDETDQHQLGYALLSALAG